MAFLDSLHISASALTAERMRMDVIAQNMASSNTTRGANGEPYRRRYVVFQERRIDDSGSRFSNFLQERIGNRNRAYQFSQVTPNRGQTRYAGVRVAYIGEDQSEWKYDYMPNHPDEDEEGYVRMPNVEVVQEMVDMMAAYRAYEANITALNVFKDMASKTLEIGQR